MGRRVGVGSITGRRGAEAKTNRGQRKVTHLDRRRTRDVPSLVQSDIAHPPAVDHDGLGVGVPTDRISPGVESTQLRRSARDLPGFGSHCATSNAENGKARDSLLLVAWRRPAVRHVPHQDGFASLPVTPGLPFVNGQDRQAARVGIVVVAELLPRRRTVLA